MVWNLRFPFAGRANILTMYWCPKRHPQVTTTHDPLPQYCIGLCRHGRSRLPFVLVNYGLANRNIIRIQWSCGTGGCDRIDH